MLSYVIDKEVSLRTFRQDDALKLYQLTIRSKSYLKEWLGWLEQIKSVKDTATYIQTSLKQIVENDGFPTNFAILYKGDIAGTIGFNTIDKHNRIGTIGYWLGEEFQGKGIMSKAFEALIHYGFKELNLNKIQVFVAVNNTKSRALPERYGFVQEGILRQAEWLYDHYVDHIIYGLLADEWMEVE